MIKALLLIVLITLVFRVVQPNSIRQTVSDTLVHKQGRNSRLQYQSEISSQIFESDDKEASEKRQKASRFIKKLVSTDTTIKTKQVQNSQRKAIEDQESELEDSKEHNYPNQQTAHPQHQNDSKSGQSDQNNHEQDDDQTHSGHHYLTPSQPDFWINVLISLGLTCVGGFCSGMTVGLMSIQTMQLEVMSMGGNEQEKRMAKSILDIVSNHHLFLVTLLLANAMALQTLPLVVHSLMPDWAAIIFSTFIVLIIGEIVPQAYCTGSKKIEIAYFAAPIIKTMIKIFWVLAYPISKGLDYLLGQHGHQRIQHKDFANFLKGESTLKKSQVVLLTSILQLRCERVTDIMVPIKKLYVLSVSQKLTGQKVEQILRKDYSYILVYRDRVQNVVGIIKVKQFALNYLKNGSKPVIVKQVCKEDENFLSVYADTNLLEMLMLFQVKSYRLALVSNKYKKIEPGIQSIMYSKSDMVMKTRDADILGVVFLYDIFKELTQFNEQLQQARPIHINQPRSVEMNEMNKPLLRENL